MSKFISPKPELDTFFYAPTQSDRTFGNAIVNIDLVSSIVRYYDNDLSAYTIRIYMIDREVFWRFKIEEECDKYFNLLIKDTQ